MTKQELALNLAIDYIKKYADYWIIDDSRIALIKRRAEAIANVLMPEEEIDGLQKPAYLDAPITRLAHVLGTLDIMWRNQRSRETHKRCVIKGYEVKFLEACEAGRIKTVGELLQLSSTDILKLRGAGLSLLRAINAALYKAYGISDYYLI